MANMREPGHPDRVAHERLVVVLPILLGVYTLLWLLRLGFVTGAIALGMLSWLITFVGSLKHLPWLEDKQLQSLFSDRAVVRISSFVLALSALASLCISSTKVCAGKDPADTVRFHRATTSKQRDVKTDGCRVFVVVSFPLARTPIGLNLPGYPVHERTLRPFWRNDVFLSDLRSDPTLLLRVPRPCQRKLADIIFRFRRRGGGEERFIANWMGAGALQVGRSLSEEEIEARVPVWRTELQEDSAQLGQNLLSSETDELIATWKKRIELHTTDRLKPGDIFVVDVMSRKDTSCVTAEIEVPSPPSRLRDIVIGEDASF